MVLTTTAALYAQVVSGDLVGSVLDATGAALPGATVSARNTGTNVVNTATANANGLYRLSSLPPGPYEISASASGFSTSTQKGVLIKLNQTSTINLTLQPAGVSTTVEVTEAGTSIDTTTAQIAQTYSTKEAQDLPIVSIGQGVLNLSLLQGGVTSSGGTGYGTGPSVGGQRPTNNNFMIEGVDNNSKSVTGPQNFVPNDDVAEFTLLQNQFRAEYGHSSGGQFNTIIKSGSNAYHGMLYEYLRNRDLNAIDQAFANQGIYSTPRYDQSRLGGNFGGPIRKDKWFFFLGFEYNPLGQASTTGSPVYAPTAAGYTTLAGIAGVNQTNLKLLQQYATAAAVTPGAPTFAVNGVTIATGLIPIQAPNYTNGYFGVLSSDYNVSDRDQIRGRLVYNRGDQIDNNATLPAFFTTVPTTNYIATLNEYHTFSANVTNELRLGYTRQNQSFPAGDFQFPGLDAFPNLQFNDLSLQLGPNSQFPQFNISNLYQIANSLTWVRGNHTFKFGYEFRDYIAPTSFTQRARGDYEYTSVAGYLLDQTPDYLAQRGLGNSEYYGNALAHYAFAQDTWRVTRKLTFDLGLRYEYTQPSESNRNQQLNAAASVPGLIQFRAPESQKTAFAPRVGVAYSPDSASKTVVRAGFGLAYDVLFDNLGVNTQPPQFSTTVDLTGTTGTGFLAHGGIPATYNAAGTTLSPADARALTTAYIPDQVLPYSINWNFDVQHVFGSDYTLEARYLGNRGVHLVTQQQLNVFSPVTATQNIPTYLTAPSLATLAAEPLTVSDLRAQGHILPQYAAAGFINPITSYTPQGWSEYNGLTLQLNKRMSKGLQLIGAYTWSHNIDNSTAVVATTYLTPRRPQNGQDFTAEKASSALDRRQRFTLSMIYDVPAYRSSTHWWLKNLVGNWEVAPVYIYESPELFTPQSGLDANLNADSATDRSIVNTSGAAGTGSGVYGLTRAGAVVASNATATGSNGQPGTNSVVAWVAMNPNARYIQAGPGAYANGGRNTESTRPIDDVNLTLIKRFHLTERLRLELQGQALNLFNHPQFTPGSVNDVALVTTFNPGTQSYVRVTNPAFNVAPLAFGSNPRVMQVVAKFAW